MLSVALLQLGCTAGMEPAILARLDSSKGSQKSLLLPN